IDGVLKIVKENDLRPDQVEKIRVGILKTGAHLIAEPAEKKIFSPIGGGCPVQHAFWCGGGDSSPEGWSRGVPALCYSIRRGKTDDEAGGVFGGS
ncbi:MAG: hypothetical protein Q8P64_11110, partial [Deltaproteobacteria bacterium]|nr:hypothetical protein [Deltaproteobacteria bacterium]